MRGAWAVERPVGRQAAVGDEEQVRGCGWSLGQHDVEIEAAFLEVWDRLGFLKWTRSCPSAVRCTASRANGGAHLDLAAEAMVAVALNLGASARGRTADERAAVVEPIVAEVRIIMRGADAMGGGWEPMLERGATVLAVVRPRASSAHHTTTQGRGAPEGWFWRSQTRRTAPRRSRGVVPRWRGSDARAQGDTAARWRAPPQHDRASRVGARCL